MENGKAVLEEKKSKMKELVSVFCDQKMNREFKEISLRLIDKMSRKKNIPFITGEIKTWAAATVYALSQINFLFDKESSPSITPDDICGFFNTNKNTTSSKAKTIRDLMRIKIFDEEFSIEDVKQANPFNNYDTDNGFIISKKSVEVKKGKNLDFKGDAFDILTYMYNQKISSDQEIEPFLNSLNETDKREILELFKNPKFKALDYVDMAEDSEPEKAAEYLEKALKLDPDCPEAYLSLAYRTKDIEMAINFYQMTIKAWINTHGKNSLKKWKGNFWGVHETRTFMRAKAGLASRLCIIDKKSEAIDIYNEILILNPNDNLGVRYILGAYLVEAERYDEYQKLHAEYPEDCGAHWLYTYTQFLFKTEGVNKNTQKALEKAFNINKHVIPYLIGINKMPSKMPSGMGLGDESEAVWLAEDIGFAFARTKGFLEWLRDFYYSKTKIIHSIGKAERK
jgi:tetratricopeptide (TPR) repeat protein